MSPDNEPVHGPSRAPEPNAVFFRPAPVGLAVAIS